MMMGRGRERKTAREIRRCYGEVGLWKGNSSTPVNGQEPEAAQAGVKPA